MIYKKENLDKNKMGEVTHVCIVDSLYSLLIYLLVINEDIFRKTFFFFDRPIPLQIAKRFPMFYRVEWPRKNISKVLKLLYLRITKSWRFPFLKTAEIYCLDNLQLTSALVGNRKFNVLEDGVENYTLLRPRKLGVLKKIVGGPLMGKHPFGYSDSAKKVILTGLSAIPLPLRDKTEIIDINEKWDNLVTEFKRLIKELYGLSENMICDFKECNSVLFTQPLSEDGAISEEEKIDIYKEIIGEKKIAIKPHPREKTNYSVIFPHNTILEPTIPIELLSFVGVRFKDVYTIFSTAVLAFPYRLNIHVYGTIVNQSLVNRFGDIRYINGNIKRVDNSQLNPIKE